MHKKYDVWIKFHTPEHLGKETESKMWEVGYHFGALARGYELSVETISESPVEALFDVLARIRNVFSRGENFIWSHANIRDFTVRAREPEITDLDVSKGATSLPPKVREEIERNVKKDLGIQKPTPLAMRRKT